MTKSELIQVIASKQNHLPYRDIELAVKTLLEKMSQSLEEGDRIEIRGFGSFSLHHREPRVGRNPKTGASVDLGPKYVPHFKPGKELRERVNVYKEATNNTKTATTTTKKTKAKTEEAATTATTKKRTRKKV